MRTEGGSRGRHRARELLVKALYQWQLAGHAVAEIRAQFSTLPEFERCDAEYFDSMLQAAIENAAELDSLIARHAARGLDQLDAVGRAILLLSLAELTTRRDVPPKVVINEAIELAKRYGPTDSFRFVNALLDKVVRERQHQAPSATGK